MTVWDANLAELRAALMSAGRKPLDDAHVFTLAVEALSDLIEAEDSAGDAEEHAKEVEDLERQLSDAQRKTDDLERDKNSAERRVDDLEGDLLAANQDLAATRAEAAELREALGGDENAQAQALVRASRELAEVREALARERGNARGCAREWASNLRNLATRLEQPRAKKDPAVFGMRANAERMERWAAANDHPTPHG